MKKIVAIFLMAVLITSLTTTEASAKPRIIGKASNYEESQKQIYVYDFDPSALFIIPYNSPISSIEEMPTPKIYQGGSIMKGTFSYPNFDSSKLGYNELEWNFTPADKTYQAVTGSAIVCVAMNAYGTMASEESEDEAKPYLPIAELKLAPSTSYYIPINDNISGSTYTWTSSNKSIATVNKKTGKVIAKAAGIAAITCNIETPFDDVFTLKTTVTVSENTELLKSSSAIILSSGSIGYASASFDPSSATCRYVSSNKSVILVDQYTGKITAKKPGTAYITCTIINTNYEVETQRYNVVVTE